MLLGRRPALAIDSKKDIVSEECGLEVLYKMFEDVDNLLKKTNKKENINYLIREKLIFVIEKIKENKYSEIESRSIVKPSALLDPVCYEIRNDKNPKCGKIELWIANVKYALDLVNANFLEYKSKNPKINLN